MDAFDFGTEKMENRVILLVHSFRSFAKLFRIAELCFGLFILLWSSTRLPFAVRISGEYFRQLVAIILSPLFIFLVCNFIVLILLLKSGRLSGESSSLCETEFYEDYSTNISSEKSSPVTEREEIVYEDKQTISEANTSESETKTVTKEALYSKVPRRTKSEKLESTGNDKEVYGKLRRSETEMCRRIDNSGDSSETVYAVDELSNEEFQKAIEDFIAKQIKFHQEEKLAIVLHDNTQA